MMMAGLEALERVEEQKKGVTEMQVCSKLERESAEQVSA